MRRRKYFSLTFYIIEARRLWNTLAQESRSNGKLRERQAMMDFPLYRLCVLVQRTHYSLWQADRERKYGTECRDAYQFLCFLVPEHRTDYHGL